jgi:hypothetical protein
VKLKFRTVEDLHNGDLLAFLKEHQEAVIASTSK